MVEIDGEKFFSTQEVAEKLGITPSRISQLRKSGLLNSHKITAKKFLYSEQHILEYIKGTTKKSSTDEPESQILELCAQTKEELVEQLIYMVSGQEDDFDKHIKDMESLSYETWKADFIKDKDEVFEESFLIEKYAQEYKFSSWIKQEKEKEKKVLEVLKRIINS